MLTFEITDDRKYIKLLDFSLNVERNHLFSFFKKKSKKANFNVLVDRGIWDGNDHFITKEGLIAVGLWKELYNFGEKYGYEIQIDGIDEMLGNYPSKEEYQEYVNTLLASVLDERGLPIVPRDYQSEGAYRALKYKFCTEELATSAGKTLIFYIYNSYLRDTGIITSKKKSLLIVPNVSLVAQTAEKFELYSANAKKWKVQIVGGDNKFKQKDFDECELFVSTYQSLQNMPKEFFLNFHVVNVDECVHPSTLITMSDGSKKEISKILIGDYVITLNDITGFPEIREVDFVYCNLSKDNQMYEIQLENGEVIKITGNHKVKLIDNSYKRVDELKEDDEIMAFS